MVLSSLLEHLPTFNAVVSGFSREDGPLIEDANGTRYVIVGDSEVFAGSNLSVQIS